MGSKWILRYARVNNLYEDVTLAEIADEHRRKTGEEPVIAIHGIGCVRYLYRNCNFHCGGQYKEFREACRNFVQKVSSSGVRLVFFFRGITPAKKNEKGLQVSTDSAEKISQTSEEQYESDATAEAPTRLPEGLIPCARVIFKDEPSAEVRLCMEGYYQEIAQYAASHKNCLGLMSSDGNFLMYKDVPCMFTFDRSLQIDDEVRVSRFRPSDIASHLGIQQQDMPALATFSGTDTINSDEIRRVHGRLGARYGRRQHLKSLVAELVKNKTVEEMCRLAFGHRWREFLDTVKAEIDHYNYKPRASQVTSEKSNLSNVLQRITAKHSSGEIPPVILSVVKFRTYVVDDVLEDLSHDRNGGTSAEEALQRMRGRMYTVLLWESGDGPFHVEEQMTSRKQRQRTKVEIQKKLPPNVVHPGLLKLWTGDLETRWRLFSWMVGAPDPEGCALRSLEPQYLVVPAAALSFLRHEAHLLSPHEAEIFAVAAVTVGRFTPQELARIHPPELDPRAVFLVTLFVRTALQVLEAAAVCGLSFPREAECQLDAYFDGKFFHNLYLKAKAQSFSRVGTQCPWDPSYLDPIHKLLKVIEGSHTSHQ